MSDPGSPLVGRAILVTRPAGQADGLAERIAQSGGTPILFPAMEIVPPVDPGRLAALIDALPEYDLVVFVSPTAVERAWPSIRERHGGWPAGVTLAAVGKGSARVLHGLGAPEVLAPEEGADSESLLALTALREMAGRRVLIVRGEGGRELLADTLRQRGAHVDLAECYRRVRPEADARPLLSIWEKGGIHAVTVSSREVLANLAEMLGEAGLALLRATPMFVLHERIAEAARSRGVVTVITTPPGEDGLIAGLLEWFAARHD